MCVCVCVKHKTDRSPIREDKNNKNITKVIQTLVYNKDLHEDTSEPLENMSCSVST